MLHGFDLSPDGRTLLIPDVRASISTPRMSRIVEYDLQAQSADTLETDGESLIVDGLWLCYSPNGRQILYCDFPFNAYTHTANQPSEVGVIERSTGAKRVLGVNTDPGSQSVQLAPTQRPAGRDVVYGSAPLTLPRGAVGPYSLYVRQDVS